MTTGQWNANMSEQRGAPTAPADLDKYVVVMGCTSTGTVGLNGPYLTAKQITAALGYGDTCDTAAQIAEQRQVNGSNVAAVPVAIYKTPVGTAGSYGAINVAAVTGTCVPAVDGAAPYGTHRGAVRIEAGGSIGTAGIIYSTALDETPTWGVPKRLGADYTIGIPESNIGFNLEPSAAQVTAFIVAAVEARAATLAHLADVTAHDAADTSAAQIALAASSVPTTGAQAWAVMNLCKTALASHETNIAAHNGPDPVNVVAHAAATSNASGVGLYLAYRTAFNAHLGIALAGSTTGLLAATATTVAPQTVAAAAMISGGITALNLYPRRLVFTTAGVTPANAPPTADITGNVSGAAQSELTFAIAQTASSATTTKAWSGTGLSVAYAAADGTAATIAIGYGMAVHNSADTTNVLVAVSPVPGTLETGDSWYVRTLAPQPATSDIDDAYVALSKSFKLFGLVAHEFPTSATMFAHISAGLDVCKVTNRLMVALARTRVRDYETSETEQAWADSISAAFPVGTTDDSRIHLWAGYGWEVPARQPLTTLLRAQFSQFCADVVRVEINEPPCAPIDQPAAGLSVWSTGDSLVGHDEGPRGDVTGLSNPDLGNRFICAVSSADPVLGNVVQYTVPWTMAADDDLIKTMPMRRVATSMERVALSAAIGQGGALLDYTPPDPGIPGDSYKLTDVSRALLHAVFYGALSERYTLLIQNGDDGDLETGLVWINPVISVAPGKLVSVNYELRVRFKGILVTLNGVLVVKE